MISFARGAPAPECLPVPGLAEHAFPFKNLVDALNLRNQAIRAIRESAIEQDPAFRRELLTFVVAGGGFSGVEAVAELNRKT